MMRLSASGSNDCFDNFVWQRYIDQTVAMNVPNFGFIHGPGLYLADPDCEALRSHQPTS
jgi:hypothetical protein